MIMSQKQNSPLLLILSIILVQGTILNCPSTQEHSTHLICQILKNTNIEQIWPTYNFSDNNYCLWNFTNPQRSINCTGNNEISDIVIEEADINGTLNVTFGWPSTMKQIDFEQSYVHSTNLFGEWDWTSLINMTNLYELDLSRNQISGSISSADFNMMASYTSLKGLFLPKNKFEINFTDTVINSDFPYLEWFQLQNNRAYGKLDTSVGGFLSHFPNLKGLYIAGQVYIEHMHGKLYGHFDNLDSISDAILPSLQYFDIAWNNFSGSLTLSPNHSLNSNFIMFEIDHNQFSGSIDWNIFSGLYRLTEVDINYNQFTGSIDWNVIADLVVNGSLRAIELDSNNFEGHVDFSWIPDEINSFVLKVDTNIRCDPTIHPCLGSNIPLNRSFVNCHNKTHCESSCQCSAKYTQYPSTMPTNVPTNIPTNAPTTSSTLSTPSNATICSTEFDGYIESTYQAALESGLCIEGALFLDVISQLMEIIDIVYESNNFMVYTTLNNDEFNKYFGVNVCGNVSINIITCFDQNTNETALVKLSESSDFGDEINDQIFITTNDTILTVYITDVVIIYSYQPTTSPTIPPKPFTESSLFIGVITAGSVLLICILFLVLYIYCKKRSLERQKSYVFNGLAVIISIAEYDNTKVENPDINDYLSDIPVDKDVTSLNELFSLLNYKVMPKKQKLNWTAAEIIHFFREEIGKELLFDENTLRYDGLLVFFTCHGVENRIITSDYKTIDKAVLHRIISCKYPAVREIPRIYFWDSCEGSAQREHGRSGSSFFRLPTINLTDYGLNDILNDEQKEMHKTVSNKNNVETEINKGIELNAVHAPNDDLWTYFTKNPDFKLAEIHAANIGFQAKCDERFGSYLTYYFVEKMKRNIEDKENKSLQKICQEIQTELHDLGKQQIVFTFNNSTGSLHFKINDKSTENETNLELIKL